MKSDDYSPVFFSVGEVRLMNAITRRLSTQATAKDLLREAAREAGMSELETIVMLDGITTSTEGV